MNKSAYKKFFSLLLVLSLLLTLSPVTPAEADELTASPTNTAAEIEAEAATPIESLTVDSQILSYVDEEVFSSGNHVLRLADEETLSTYVFLNADGTKTVYYMDEAVKFLDSEGSVREKDLTLTAVVGGFATTQNNIGLSIPNDPANGITLLWNNNAVRLIPQGGIAGETIQAGNSVRYIDYYGTGADLVYTPTLTGVKEDIVLESYTGQNTFTFMLNTGGLYLYSTNGRYYLAESKTAINRIELGDVVTFDANGRFSVGTMTAQTVTSGQIYRLTLTLDESFLTDENTVYPICIDPTIRVSDDTTVGSIEDTTVYSGKPTANANWSYMHTGYYDSAYGIGRVMFRLTGLLSDSTYQGILSDQIQSAYFYLKEATGVSAATILLYPFRGNSSWTESGATWNNTGQTNTVGPVVTTIHHDSNAWGSYDITSLLIDWKTGEENANSGFILHHSNESSATKGFYSSEYATTSNRPYVVVTYTTGLSQIIPDGTYYVNNLSSGKYVRYTSSGPVGNSGLIATLGTSIRWELVRVSGGYALRLASDPTKYLAVPASTTSSAVEIVSTSSTTVPQRCVWSITRDTSGYYLLKSVHNSRYLYNAANSSTLYTNTTLPTSHLNYLWRFADTSTYRELSSSFTVDDIVLNLGSSSSISVNRLPDAATWSSVSDFTIEFASGSNDSILISSVYINALQPGLSFCTVTHNVTGLTKTIQVFVRNTYVDTNDISEIYNRFASSVGSGYSNLYGYNIYTVEESLDIILSNDTIITDYCNAYMVPKEFVQSVLFREIWCLSTADSVADSLVLSYYNWKLGYQSTAPDVIRTDSSTGLGQIFASTAISAINNASLRNIIAIDRQYNKDNWEDVWYIWNRLHTDNEFNISCCALVILDCQYEYADSIPYIDFFSLSETQIKCILARYNGYGEQAASYGDICYVYYQIFNEYNL